jgi:ESX secretion system protein EccA
VLPALGLSVRDRQRPADPAAARAGFAALTRIVGEQSDAWTGLAAAGEASADVVGSIWRTRDTAGVLQRQIELAAAVLGFTYDTGLYLQFRAVEPADFQLAYAATLSGRGDYGTADRLVGELIDRRRNRLRGRYGPAVDALDPLSVDRLAASVQLHEGLLAQLWWPADSVRLAAA